MDRYDAIIIGDGLNGLTAGAYLARAGMSVAVVEHKENDARAGGDQSADDERLETLGQGRVRYFCPKVARDLDLHRHGVRFLSHHAGVLLLDEGDFLVRADSALGTYQNLQTVSNRDADRYLRYVAEISRRRDLLSQLSTDSASGNADLGAASGIAEFAARSSARDVHDIYEILTSSASDFLDARFETESAKTLLTMSVLSGQLGAMALGPNSPTSATALLDDPFSSAGPLELSKRQLWGIPKGGVASLKKSLMNIIRDNGGASIEGEVNEFQMEKNHVTGIGLTSGMVLSGDRFLSTLDAKKTILTLFEWQDLPQDMLANVAKLRNRGTMANIILSLDFLPEFEVTAEYPDLLRGPVYIANSLSGIDRSHDCWRQNILHDTLPLEFVVPTLIDESQKIDGRHWMSIMVHYVPKTIGSMDWNGEMRARFLESTLDRLSAFAPNLEQAVHRSIILTPDLLEQKWGQTGGHIYGGEPTIDRLFYPGSIPGMNGFELPLSNLFLCNTDASPEGSTLGRFGARVAKSILMSEGAGA